MAAKIKDGLFVGDAETSRDVEFLELNKISNLINLAGGELPNMFASNGLVYFTLNWEDRQSFELFPKGQEVEVIEDLCEFIDVSLRHGISVLLFSTRGAGRCIVASVVYLMYKYRWGFEKAYEYVQAKKPDVDLNRGFIQQLFAIDQFLQTSRGVAKGGGGASDKDGVRASKWDPSYLEDVKRNPNKLSDYDNDELILVNSFLNGKLTITELPKPSQEQPKKSFTISFNSQDEEEDIHMFPTAPQGPTARPARGALKGCRQKFVADQVALDGEGAKSERHVKARTKEVSSPAEPKAMERASPGRRISQEAKRNDVGELYEFVGLGADSASARRRSQQMEESKARDSARGAWGSPSKEEKPAVRVEEARPRQRRDLTLEEIAAGALRDGRRDRGALTQMQRSGTVRAVHPDLNLSDLERELFPLENLTDYEAYRNNLRGVGTAAGSGGGGTGTGVRGPPGMVRGAWEGDSGSGGGDRRGGSVRAPSPSSRSTRGPPPVPPPRTTGGSLAMSSVGSEDAGARVPKVYRRGSPAPRAVRPSSTAGNSGGGAAAMPQRSGPPSRAASPDIGAILEKRRVLAERQHQQQTGQSLLRTNSSIESFDSLARTTGGGSRSSSPSRRTPAAGGQRPSTPQKGWRI